MLFRIILRTKLMRHNFSMHAHYSDHIHTIIFNANINSLEKNSLRRKSCDRVARERIISILPVCLPKFVSKPQKATINLGCTPYLLAILSSSNLCFLFLKTYLFCCFLRKGQNFFHWAMGPTPIKMVCMDVSRRV